MTHESKRFRSSRPLALSVGGARSLVLLASLSLSAAAQSARVFVSTTDDVPATAGIPFPVNDGDMVAVESGLPVAPFLAGGHFLASTGFVPGDIDAYAHLPSSTPGRAAGNVLSLLSNEGGFLDGDLVALASGGGAVLLVSELDLVNVLGVPAANIDVDALAYDDQGRILFSVNTDLPGTVVGDVLDGDVLRLEPAFAGVTRLLSEADVQARFTLATGMADAVLDLQALEWAGGELWGAVQSPSRHDGSIIAFGNTPRIVFDENAMGLGGSEVDALGDLRAGDELPVTHMSPDLALPGDAVHIETRGRPGSVVAVVLAGRTGFVDFARFPGFGGWYVDPFDPWLVALMSVQALPLVTLDGNGHFSFDWHLPPGSEFGTGMGGELGWSFQLMDFTTKQLSAPFRVQKL
jgi:hypothetical protein